MSIFDDDVLFASMQQLLKVPVLLDNDPEMQVGVMLINPGYAPDFDAGNPLTTHMTPCPVHGRHVDHYSLPSTDKKGVRIDIHIHPVEPQPKRPVA